MFCTAAGTPLAAGNVRRTFKKITKAAELGEDWTPRELRTSFVSLMSGPAGGAKAAMATVARRHQALSAEISTLDTALAELVTSTAPSR